MAESEEHCHKEVEAEEVDTNALNYKPPAEKSLGDILSTDAEDESLIKYKIQLLGQAAQSADLIFFPEDPRKVIVTELALVSSDKSSAGKLDNVLDLTGDLKKLKEKVFIIKEGCNYQIQVSFYVQREIVAGLKYVQKTYRSGVRCDETKQMVGSYAPQKDLHRYKTPMDEAPSGMLARGTYTVKSKFTDDDKASYLEWEWKFQIKKDWE